MGIFDSDHPGHIVVDGKSAGYFLYGRYLFTVGQVHQFIRWLNAIEHPYGRILSKGDVCSLEFNSSWAFLGEEDRETFRDLQAEFNSTC